MWELSWGTGCEQGRTKGGARFVCICRKAGGLGVRGRERRRRDKERKNNMEMMNNKAGVCVYVCGSDLALLSFQTTTTKADGSGTCLRVQTPTDRSPNAGPRLPIPCLNQGDAPECFVGFPRFGDLGASFCWRVGAPARPNEFKRSLIDTTHTTVRLQLSSSHPTTIRTHTHRVPESCAHMTR